MMLLMLFCVALTIVVFLLTAVGLPGQWLYLGVVVATLALYVVLRIATASGHPSYLSSWLSFHLNQPKTIDVSDGKKPSGRRTA